jgi:hypothetical protein
LSFNFCPPASAPLPPILYFLLSICAINEPITSVISKHFLCLYTVLYPLECLFTAFSEVSLIFSVCLVSHPSIINVLNLVTVTM